MKVSGLFVLCVFIPLSVKALDINLMTQKIKHVDQNVYEKMSKLEEVLEVKLKKKIDDLKEELTERINDAADKVVDGGMGTRNIEQMGTGVKLLHETYRDWENIIASWRSILLTCSINSLKGMNNSASSFPQMCSVYLEHFENLTKEADVCNDLKLQRMNNLEALKNNTERGKKGNIEMNFESTRLEQTTSSGYQSFIRPDERDKKLVILPYYSSSSQSWSHMDLDCYTVRDYPESHMGYIYSAVYLRKQDKLLVGTSGPKIVVVNLMGTDETVIKYGIETRGMALNEEEDIVYMSTQRPRHTIAKMSTNGTIYRKIASLPKYSWLEEVAIDKQERLLYVRDVYTITQMTFDGQNITKIIQESELTGLALDGLGHLFYVTSGTLMKFSFEKNATFPMNRFDFYIKDMVFHDDKIYFSEQIPSMQRHSARIGIVEQTENYLAYTTHRLKKSNIFGFLLLLV